MTNWTHATSSWYRLEQQKLEVNNYASVPTQSYSLERRIIAPNHGFLWVSQKFLLLHFIGKDSTPPYPPPKHKWHHGTNTTDNYSKTFIFIRKPILPFKIVLLAITTNKERPVCNQLQWEKFITHCTLLMRRFWGLRSLWSTLQLWQKARPLSNWYINDYGENNY